MARVLIVTPADSGSHKGNRITAVRWARMLRVLGQHVTLEREWDNQRCDIMLALHARKSARSIVRFARHAPTAPLLVALAGTDLYHDIHTHATARKSLELATRLILLQPHGVAELPPHVRSKVDVILQSAEPYRGLVRPLKRSFEICVAGHLRSVKDPFRAALAARLLPSDSRVRVTHLGAALSESMARRAEAEMVKNRRYRWLGDVAPRRARQLIARARLLVLSSKMEGGANVLSEALVSRVPALATRISGSLGMLGDDYPGYFDVGQTEELAALMTRCETSATFYNSLMKHCARRAKLFEPAAELEAWRTLLQSLGEKA